MLRHIRIAAVTPRERILRYRKLPDERVAARLRMCKGVTVCGLATTDVAASHAQTCWSAHATFSASGVVGLKSPAVCIVEVRALAGLDLSHAGLSWKHRLKSMLQQTD